MHRTATVIIIPSSSGGPDLPLWAGLLIVAAAVIPLAILIWRDWRDDRKNRR